MTYFVRNEDTGQYLTEREDRYGHKTFYFQSNKSKAKKFFNYDDALQETIVGRRTVVKGRKK